MNGWQAKMNVIKRLKNLLYLLQELRTKINKNHEEKKGFMIFTEKYVTWTGCYATYTIPKLFHIQIYKNNLTIKEYIYKN